MIKIHEISDVHLEFGAYRNKFPNVSVLCLDGDITLAKLLAKKSNDAHARSFKKKAAEFFESTQNISHVLYVFGNHEHYHGDLLQSREWVQEFLDEYGFNHVHILENDEYKVQDVVFLGCTLWTDMNSGDLNTLISLRHMMNDFKTIHRGEFLFTPEDAWEIHKESKAWLEKKIEEHKDEKVVVITHHAPCKLSTHPRHKEDVICNGGYSSDLTRLMAPNVKLWFHGHTHDCFDYMIDQTRVKSNPRGYDGHENTGYDPNLVIEI